MNNSSCHQNNDTKESSDRGREPPREASMQHTIDKSLIKFQNIEIFGSREAIEVEVMDSTKIDTVMNY